MDNPERLIALVDEYRALAHELPCVEFKVDNFDPERIGTLISAISNTARLVDQPCGYVIWGVENDTHDVAGTIFRPGKEKAHGQPLELWLSNSVSPSLYFTFKEVPHPKGRLIVLEIPPATQVPTKFKNIAYIRIGETTPKLADHPSHEASLLPKLQPFVWEQGIAMPFIETAELMQVLDVVSYFQLTEQPVPRTNEAIAQVLEHDKLVSRDVGGRWNLLNAGAILFANDVRRIDTIGRKTVRVIRYDGTSRSDLATEFPGRRGYAIAFEALVDYVNKLLPKTETISRPLRVARPIYPVIAVRELVANALIHQDMTIGGTGPLIELFADRVEITNPGKPLLETNRFIDMPPRSRNETLASMMRRIGVCEERGSGVDKAIDAIEEAQLPPPDLRADGANTKIIIFGPKTFGELTPEERVRGCYQHACLRFVNSHSGITNGSLRQRFGVAVRNAAQITRVLNQAVDMELIRQSDNWTARAGQYLPYWA